MEETEVGPYRLLGELGRGGMGTVYRAAVTGAAPGLESGATVALKVIHPHLLETPGFFKRFLREAELGRSIDHENVVRTYDCDAVLHDGVQQNFLVMEFVEGQTLRQLQDELERVPEELCRHIGCEVAKGLQAIHEAGVLHRDLKPENVLITPDHGVKVMDLGVARLQDEAIRLSKTGAFVGSVEYAAPEQLQAGDGNPDARADLHALGLVLYEMATGWHPYRDETLPKVLQRILHHVPRGAGEINPQLSGFFEEVLRTLLAKNPADRFETASELATVLDSGDASAWWKGRAARRAAEGESRHRRVAVPRETALYGRAEDLATLESLYERVRQGTGQVVLIEGEAGIGKTRLVDECVARLRRNGHDLHFLLGSHPPLGAITLTGGLMTALRDHFEDVGLEEGLRRHLGARPGLVTGFAAALRGDVPPEGSDALVPDALAAAFIATLRALAAEKPVVLLVDDLHFATREGRALFAGLAAALVASRVLLIGTARRGLSADWTAELGRFENCTRISLARLGPRDLVRLLRDVFRSERLAIDLAAKIGEKSDGNPFFVFEIIRGLKEEQRIAQRPDGSWVTTQIIESIDVPSSVLDLVNARVADLEDAERDLLDAAACCGFEFDPLLVGDALGLTRILVLKRLAQIERRHRLVRSNGTHYVFDHHQVQEALYRSTNALLRQEYHRAIAEASERRLGVDGDGGGAVGGREAVGLCEHLVRAGEGERALPYLHPALDHLQRAALYESMWQLASETLEPDGLVEGGERVQVLRRAAWALQYMGRYEDMEAVFDEALSLARSSADELTLCGALADQGWFHLIRHRWADAEQTLEEAHELAVRLGDKELEMRSTGDLANLCDRMGRHDESRSRIERAIDLARELGQRDKEAVGIGHLAKWMKVQGRNEEAEALVRRYLAMAKELGSPTSELYASMRLGILLQDLGRFDEALTLLERALQIAREFGIRIAESAALVNLSGLKETQGHYDDVVALTRQAIELDRELGLDEGVCEDRANLAYALWCKGALQEARQEIRAAMEGFARLGVLPQPPNMETQAQIDVSLGQLEDCRARLHAYRQDPRAAQWADQHDHIFVALGAVETAAGELAAAEAALREGLAFARERGRQPMMGRLLAMLGAVLVQRECEDDARAVLDEALAVAEELGTPDPLVLAACCRAALPGVEPGPALQRLRELEPRLTREGRLDARFWLWRATGRPEHLSEAKRLLDAILDAAPSDARGAMQHAIWRNRRILEASGAPEEGAAEEP